MNTSTRITSPTNSFIKFLVTLHERKAREQAGNFLAEGVRICGSLLDSPLRCEKLVVIEELYAQAQAMISSDLIVVVTDGIMRKISSATTPSGMVGLFGIPQQPPLEQLSSGLVLAQIMDPGNMGTLIRSSVAFNKKSIVLIGGVDPWSPKTVQSSAGTIGNISVYALSWDEFFACTSSNGRYELLAMVVRDGVDPRTLTYSTNHFFIVGSEAQGIPTAWVEQCTRRITLPMPGPAESLNAGIAGSLMLALAHWQTNSIG